jgi:hypothetical protein
VLTLGASDGAVLTPSRKPAALARQHRQQISAGVESDGTTSASSREASWWRSSARVSGGCRSRSVSRPRRWCGGRIFVSASLGARFRPAADGVKLESSGRAIR